MKSLGITLVLLHQKVAKPWAFTTCHGPRAEGHRHPLNLQPREKTDPDLKEKREGALYPSVWEQPGRKCPRNRDSGLHEGKGLGAEPCPPGGGRAALAVWGCAAPASG